MGDNMIIDAENMPDMEVHKPIIPSNGEKRIKRSSLNIEQGRQIRLTNDERRALLDQFKLSKRIKRGWSIIALGIGTSAFAAIVGLFNVVWQRMQGAGIVTLCLALLGVPIVIYGIRELAICPKIEKCNLNAYEFTVEAIETMAINHRDTLLFGIRSDDKQSHTSLSADEASRFVPSESRLYRIILTFGGRRVELCNPESYNAFRWGISIGDKVRCAVLETGKYCFITVF